jgi:hypothetical protein
LPRQRSPRKRSSLGSLRGPVLRRGPAVAPHDVGRVATPSAPRHSAHRRVGHLEGSFVSGVRGGQAAPLSQPWRLVPLVRH